MNCVRLKDGPGGWFLEQDKGSAVPHHGFGTFLRESLRFFREAGDRAAGYGMVEINFQRLSRRPFSTCKWLTSDTEFRTSLITDDATIDRLEDPREMLMQAALRGRSRSQQLQHCYSLLQAETVAVTQTTRNRNDASLRHTKAIPLGLAKSGRRDWGPKSGITGSFEASSKPGV
jgi:hypothetical protein